MEMLFNGDVLLTSLAHNVRAFGIWTKRNKRLALTVLSIRFVYWCTVIRLHTVQYHCTVIPVDLVFTIICTVLLKK
jgi:hypothetical protein